MIIEKEKILWKPRNAGVAFGGSAYTGIYAHGVNVRIFHLMRNIYILKNYIKQWQFRYPAGVYGFNSITVNLTIMA
jgi:hypothetical protein